MFSCRMKDGKIHQTVIPAWVGDDKNSGIGHYRIEDFEGSFSNNVLVASSAMILLMGIKVRKADFPVFNMGISSPVIFLPRRVC